MLTAGRQGMDLNGRVEDAEAARLRAIAAEVAPDSETPLDHEIATYGLHVAWIRWAAKYETRVLLLQAAAEAEESANA